MDRIIKYLTLALFKGIALLTTVAQPAMADASSVKHLESQIGHYQNELKRLEQEYEFTRHKRETTEQKLQETKREFQEKQVQLSMMKSQTGETLTGVQRDAIANEQKRLTLISIGIESQQSAFERLLKKEEELLLQMKKNQQAINRTRKEIEDLKYSEHLQLKAERQEMAEQLKQLRMENERLKQAMEEEAIKAEQSREAAQTNASENSGHISAPTDTGKQTDEPTRTLSWETQRLAALELLLEKQLQVGVWQDAQASGEDTSQAVLPGEAPIHQDDEDSDVILRSRTLEREYPMTQVAPNQYEAEVVIEPGQEKAYFDVKNRRFRGRFPEVEKPVTYVFTLDLSEEYRPALELRKKESDEQMASHAEAPL